MVRLNHRGVLPVFDSGEDRGQPYVAMKLVGPSLERLLSAQGTLAAGESARLVAEIARAVDYLHQHDVVHCDLKPSNILLDGDQPLITDFGLSRVLKGESEMGPTGQLRIEGTIPYMAPEQVRGDPGKSSDIYALGALLLELLTGETPFGKGRAALNRILNDTAPGPRHFDSSIPNALDRIVRKCLQKDPADRYGSAAQVAAELERYRRKEPLVHTPADTHLQRLYFWSRRHRELTCRLIGLSSVLLLTQFNYFTVLKAGDRDLWLHIPVSCVEALWIIASIVFDRLSWKEGPNEPLRPVWIAIDVLLLTCLLGVLNAVSTAYVIGYPLLIAISGLWSRVRLVWLTTFLCIAGYLVLVLDANYRQGVPLTTGTRSHDPIGVLAIIVVTGYVIAVQTERARALGEVNAPQN
jgi:serine/threonine-protein kinase